MFSNILKILERRFIENGAGKYIVWNKVSLPDIFLSNSFAQFFNSKVMNEFFSDLSEQFPLKVSEIITALKQADLKEYYFEKDYNDDAY